MRGRKPQTDKSKLGPHPNRVQHHRLAAGLTQPQVAEQTGMAVQTLSKLERGFTKLHASHLRRLAPALNVHAMELLADGPQFSKQQRELLRLMEQLPEVEQERVLSIVKLSVQSPRRVA